MRAQRVIFGTQSWLFTAGFPLGFQATPPGSATKRTYIFNHIQFIIGYHQEHGSASDAEAEALADVDHSKDISPADEAAAKEAGVKYRRRQRSLEY